jgi:hypothetical protein
MPVSKRQPMIKVLAAVHDPGGVRALYPVLAMLGSQEAVQLEIIAESDAGRYLDSMGVPFTLPPMELSADVAGRLLANSRPAVLVTGTSWGSILEQVLRNAAARCGISSLVVIDYWTNYELRWKGAEYPIPELRDWVCLPDIGAATEMAKQGFPARRLLVTGQPHLERLLRSTPPQKSEGCLRHILLLSQPDIESNRSLTTKEVMEVLLNAIAHSSAKSPVTLSIKPHPKESSLLDLGSLAASPNMTVRLIDRSDPIERAIAAADVVVGYFSMALFEARAANKPTIAMEVKPVAPSLRRVLRSFGIHMVPLNENELAAALRPVPAFPITRNHDGATERIAKAILDLARGVTPVISPNAGPTFAARLSNHSRPDHDGVGV